MLEDIEKLLGSKRFWYTFIGVNVLCLLTCPAVVVVSLAGVALLYGLLRLGRFLQRLGFATIARFAVVVFSFLLTMGIVGFALQSIGLDFSHTTVASVTITLIVSASLWFGCVFAWRTWKGKRQQQSDDDAKRQYEHAERERADRQRQQAHAQKRREDARANLEMLYSLYAPELKGRFPRADFEAFLQKYLSDNREPQYVEERADQLEQIIEQHRQKIEPPKKKMSLADLAQWFLREKQQIDASPLGSDDKQLLLSQLEERFAKLQEKYIRGVEP